MFTSRLIPQFLIILLIIKSECLYLDPARFTRSTGAGGSENSQSESEGYSNGEMATGHNERSNKMSWLHGHMTTLGNTSEADVRAILNSMQLLSRPESTKFPRLKVYNYKFDDGDVREVLVYSDPDEERQWMVTIEDIDLRQNLIVFKMGDLGFGFAKDNTYVVLRKSTTDEDPFHYLHLAYIQPRQIYKGSWEVEWDNLKPRDLLPIPLILNEPEEDHEEHCDARKCGLKEFIFGTCPIVKLTCEDLKKLPLEGHERERIEALLREKQPFVYELAKSLSVNNRYLEREGDDSKQDDQESGDEHPRRKKRAVVDPHLSSSGHTSGDNTNSAGEMGHHSVKKDHALVASSGAHSEVVASGSGHQRKVAEAKSVKGRLKAPALETIREEVVEDTEETRDESQARPSRSGRVTASTVASGSEPDDLDVVKQEEERESYNGNKEKNVRLSRQTDPERDQKHDTQSNDERRGNPNRTHSYPKSTFDKLLLKKTPVAAANLTLGIVPIQQLPKLPEAEKSYFENVLDKIRNSPPSKYTARPYECVTCEPIGTFMSEYAENPLVSYVVNNLMGDIFKGLGSKRKLFSPEANEVLQEHARIPYIGYGSCRYSVEILTDSPKSGEIDDIIDFYSETLAVNCEEKDCESQRPRTRMRELLTSKYHLLEIWPDWSVRVNKTSELPKNLILSTKEFRQFMVSLIFAAFTTEYRMQSLDHTDEHMDKIPNRHMSPRMKFQTRLILRIVDDLVKTFSHHLIKGLRYLLQLLQEKYLALVAEQLAILEFNFNGNEKERAAYKIINKSDRFQVLAIKDFLINGIAPITRGGSTSLPSFSTFFSRNRKRILNMVIDQGIGHEHRERPMRNSNNKTVRSVDVDEFWRTLNVNDVDDLDNVKISDVFQDSANHNHDS